MPEALATFRGSLPESWSERTELSTMRSKSLMNGFTESDCAIRPKHWSQAFQSDLVKTEVAERSLRVPVQAFLQGQELLLLELACVHIKGRAHSLVREQDVAVLIVVGIGEVSPKLLTEVILLLVEQELRAGGSHCFTRNTRSTWRMGASSGPRKVSSMRIQAWDSSFHEPSG
jgi:hypothetical protein